MNKQAKLCGKRCNYAGEQFVVTFRLANWPRRYAEWPRVIKYYIDRWSFFKINVELMNWINNCQEFCALEN